ncbi:MAG: 50S ribosomal protein L29 [Akkermansiaceae bacterium]|nr:50S ribosomal protein L29 [Akkermansiaceae bacterium]MCP5543296.1 50S ribosomal protein L29 [Akkermansiaceae bacterium]MCP5548150.1 50S ribosomal protein L29 [Akkermansiaceae bacterium]
MAKTKAKDINELTLDELGVRLRDLKEEALNLRLQQSTGQLENAARIRTVRRETARVMTAISAKQSA